MMAQLGGISLSYHSSTTSNPNWGLSRLLMNFLHLPDCLICLSRIELAGKQCMICLTRIDLVDEANLPSLIILVRGTKWYREVPRVIKRYQGEQRSIKGYSLIWTVSTDSLTWTISPGDCPCETGKVILGKFR